MNNLRLVSLNIDDFFLAFNPGKSYVVGQNASGKTTIFNCIRYALGLVRDIRHANICHVGLKAYVGDVDIHFSRNIGDTHIDVSCGGITHRLNPQSEEFYTYLSSWFDPAYLYGSQRESILPILNFCFLSEEQISNRRQQWEAINSICGINVNLLGLAEKDIRSLSKEVSWNRRAQDAVNEYSALLSRNITNDHQAEEAIANIERTKKEFFAEFANKENLLNSATSKLEAIRKESQRQLSARLSEIEGIFIDLRTYLGYNRWEFDGLEAFVRGRSKSMSYGEELFSRFILVLAIAKASRSGTLNFPNIIVNDNYLSPGLDRSAYSVARKILDEMVAEDIALQYIEFTYNEDVPQEHQILNLNDREGRRVFRQ